MPFPPDMIVPWVQHTVKERQCWACGLKNIPFVAIHPGNLVYEKQGRFNLDIPDLYNICQGAQS